MPLHFFYSFIYSFLCAQEPWYKHEGQRMTSECSVIVSSEVKTFHPSGKLLKQEDKQFQTASASPWNWPDSLGPPSQDAHKSNCWDSLSDKTTCKEWDQASTWKKQRLAKLPVESLRALSNLKSRLQAVQCAPRFQPCFHPCWVGFGDTAIFGPFPLL